MPTYEFRCPNGHVFDRFHRISEVPATVECPTCGAPAERAISGGAGLVFKGSGFYLTDYGKNAHRGTAPAAKPAEGGKSESSGGESKPSGGDAKPAAPSTPSTGGATKGGSSKASE
ncbi:zinc ribbon domain-containing protein [Roseisolibacter sp. H3M3-2]|uniref:FmdB family zinc ribbon protein n=1 Tax=Roseisolibacter sp. H3M3-2 TaxID=3031323 RepID=UPI0023DAD97A|nr:zinc ribbon domain-containing protein [Roseisolibacter sp. H3M3-2]MDF1503329.1 zinc ribbon domain-containing protein [Roseisolibacter sp. H3M3-2]